MYKLKDILKVLLIALFICVYGAGDVRAQAAWDLVGQAEKRMNESNTTLQQPTAENNYSIVRKPKDYVEPAQDNQDTKKTCEPACGDGENCVEGTCQKVSLNNDNTKQNSNFCGTDGGAFSELVKTGVLIFKRLRDLIYVVAGFGIIAVAVGGFFGNLNWKWLGAIIISLVVIASAGEIVVMITGCEDFDDKLITNTITDPTSMSTQEFNDKYTESVSGGGWISYPYTGPSEAQMAEEAGLAEITTE